MNVIGFDWEYILGSEDVETAYRELVDSAPEGVYCTKPVVFCAPQQTVSEKKAADEDCDDTVLPFA